MHGLKSPLIPLFQSGNCRINATATLNHSLRFHLTNLADTAGSHLKDFLLRKLADKGGQSRAGSQAFRPTKLADLRKGLPYPPRYHIGARPRPKGAGETLGLNELNPNIIRAEALSYKLQAVG